MIFIDRTQTDPFFNIAAEEYALKNYNEDIFMLWINKPAVIIGKHQVAAAEANIFYTYEKGIPVIRRITGGGTVYHDEGNLNYSLIKRGKQGQLVDYEKYAGTVIRALARYDLRAELSGKSSLVIDGKKFSGNAEHIFKDRVLHHGTLLFNTNLDELRRCIRPEHNGYDDKAIKSVDSHIVNLSQLLPEGFEMKDFKNIIIEQLYEDFPGTTMHSFNETEKNAIWAIAKEKYSSMEWNFAYSPKYILKGVISMDDKLIDYQLASEKGRIDKVEFRQNEKVLWQILSRTLQGKFHHPGVVLDIVLNESGKIFSSRKHARQLAESLF
jgi:lipoate-protein ligase A